LNFIKSIFILIFLFVCFYAFCEEDEIVLNETNNETNLEEENINDEFFLSDEYSEESIFIINSFNYNVKGRTLPFVLNNKTELKKGEEIIGRTKFIEFIIDKKQLLTNERVLKDNVRIEYEIGEANEDGKYPVDLEIYVEDTWNLFALPYPKYDSNYGFSLTVKARDYNFFGTMQPLRIDIGYKYNQNEQSYFSLMIDSGFPFQVFGLNWFFDFDNYFDYRPDLQEPFYYKNKTGISLELPISRSTLTLLFAESFIWNEENADSDKPALGEVQEGLYLSSNPSISWKIPTGLEIGKYGELTYTPNIYAVINHEIDEWELSYNRKGPILFFAHSLNFGRLDWKSNLREGINISLSNSYSYNFYYPQINAEPWSYYYSVDTKLFFIFIKDRLGFSSRINARHWINSHYDYAGDLLRGVYDNFSAEFILSLNLDLHIRALRIKADEWFPKNKFFGSLGFDLHINPVIDVAYYKKYQEDFAFDGNNFLVGAGFDIIIYPHKFRSVFFRISTCWDFSDISEKTPIELFLGMEHHY